MVLAQDEEELQGLIYDPNTLYTGESGIELGNTVTILVKGDNTVITSPIGNDAVGMPTNGLGSTVFYNGSAYTLSAINAGSGSEISTTGTDAAIQNGSDDASVAAKQRAYKMRVGIDTTGAYYIEYGYYFLDAPNGWFPITDYEELPQIIRDFNFPAEDPLWVEDDGTPGRADLGNAYELRNIVGLDGPGDVVELPMVSTLTIYNRGVPETDLTAIAGTVPQGVYDAEVLPPIVNTSGGTVIGNLVINERPAPQYHNHEGDRRTLIQGAALAIENHGTLTVNDARIQVTGQVTGITDPLLGTYYSSSGIGILHEYTDYTTGDPLTLNNTQIGEPAGGGGYAYVIDPNTGLPVPVEDPDAVTTGGIAVNEEGRPIQTWTHIAADGKIMADGVNGRIIAGHDVTMRRNAIGEAVYDVNDRTNAVSDFKTIVDNIDMINGPTIGILARSHVDFSIISDDEEETPSQTGLRWLSVYTGGYTSAASSIGYFDSRGGYYGSLLGTSLSTIDVNDHSWIFANTGISFGKTGSQSYSNAVSVTVDSTSGIYAGGYNPYYYYYGAGAGTVMPSVNFSSYDYNYGGAIGITDRYSLVQLYAHSGDEIYTTAMPGYSGSFHEIHVDGKVIAGSASRSGIQIRFQDLTGMNPIDQKKLQNVYYHDPNDEFADKYGNVHYSAETADRFVAYNDQPNRVFWLASDVEGRAPIALTYYDTKTQRWFVHPNASTVKIGSGNYSSSTLQTYFTPFDTSAGLGIDVVGTSMAYEGNVLEEGFEPWSTYYGPTVRQIEARGDDALISGGKFHPGTIVSSTLITATGGAAMQFGPLAHVAKVNIGENNDVKNLSDVLFDASDMDRSVSNFQAFDQMTSIKRSKLLYDPTLAYDPGEDTNDNENFQDNDHYHFDNSGVHGDIVSWYNAVVDVWWSGIVVDDGGEEGGEGEEGAAGGTGEEAVIGSGTWTGGVWSGGVYSLSSPLNSFWIHSHPVPIDYNVEVLGGVATTTGPSYLLGHRDLIYGGTTSALQTADDIDGRSLILDEILLYNLAGRIPNSVFDPAIMGTAVDSFGYADNARHYREALAWFLYGNGTSAEGYAGLSVPELLEGYTRDGTLIVFSNGDIFSGNILGGGVGDSLASYYLGNMGNIDLRFTDGTTIFNRNVLETAEGSHILRNPGIRVRDMYVEKTGHLLMNDVEFAVNPFDAFSGSLDYANRLIIHDVLNEGIVSGNGVFQIAQRNDFDYGIDYFDGYFINRGILAPGLNGYIGENEHQAMELEQDAYDNMLDAITNTAGSGSWEQLMRAVPGGQFGTITVFGSLWLTDEHHAPYYDPSKPETFNRDHKIDAGEYHVTIGNDTIHDIFSKYVSTIADAKSTYNPEDHTYDPSLVPDGELSQEDWKTIAMEKLGTHLSWFSSSAMVDKKTGLPLLTQYEQFMYLTNPAERTRLQRQVLEMVLTPQELVKYDSDPAQRAALNQRLLNENNIRFEFTQMDHLLWRYGFSDVVSVHGTIPSYWYRRNGWETNLTTDDLLSSSFYNNINNAGSKLIGMTKLGGIVQADRIFDTDADAADKEKQTSFIIVASEGFTDDSVKTITSDTSKWVFANVDILPLKMATGQMPAVLTVIDDPDYYRNRVSRAGDSYNARSVAHTLDQAMLTNPGLALSFQFGLNSPEVLNDTLRQVASSTRANSLIMNLSSPSDNLFNQIGYGHGGLSTGQRGNVIFRNNGRYEQPYGQPAVPPQGSQYAPPMGGLYRGQSPMYRTGSIWGAYTHSNFSMGDDGNSFAYNYYRNGAMIGSEWNLTPSSVLGGVASLNQGTLQSMSDEVTSTDYSFGLYLVAAPFEQFEVKSYLGGGYQSYKTDRYIRNSEIFIGGNTSGTSYGLEDVFGIDDHYDSETQGYSFNYAVEFARPFTVNPNFVIRPAAGFEYQNLRQNGYAEQMSENSRASWSNNGSNMAEFNELSGAASGTYAMNYKKMDFSRSLVRLGINTESYFARGGWQFRGYYVHKLTGDRYPISEQSFVSGSQNFKVRGGELGNAYVQVGLGTHFWLNRDRTATLFVNGDWNFSLVNKGYSLLNINTGLQLSF